MRIRIRRDGEVPIHEQLAAQLVLLITWSNGRNEGNFVLEQLNNRSEGHLALATQFQLGEIEKALTMRNHRFRVRSMFRRCFRCDLFFFFKKRQRQITER